MWAERLRDGQEILIRPIRPDDREELAEGMRRLSPESRYRRFFTPTSELSAAALSYLTEVDHHDHEALVALDPDSGHGVGVARFVRSADDPEVAEVAVAVADSWHNRGVATALLDRLTQRAREEGVRRFSAEVLAENRPMLELIPIATVLALIGVCPGDRTPGALPAECLQPDTPAALAGRYAR